MFTSWDVILIDAEVLLRAVQLDRLEVVSGSRCLVMVPLPYHMRHLWETPKAPTLSIYISVLYVS